MTKWDQGEIVIPKQKKIEQIFKLNTKLKIIASV